MTTIYGAVDLLKNELRNAVVQNLGTPPATPVAGQLYFDSTGGDMTLYWYDGSQWVAAKGGAGTTLGGSAAALVVGGAGTGGISTDASRGDHVHALANWGTVTAQTSFGAASGNGSGVTFARNDHTHGTPVHDNAAHSAITLNSLAVPTASVAWNSQKITGLADPTLAQDGATKNYVDNLSAGLSWKDSVRAATTANGTMASAFQNGAIIDGVTLVTGNRILLKNQTTTSENGIYTVNASGAPTRATDADLGTEVENACVFISEGTTLADTSWVCTTNAPITVGSTGLAFAQFGGGAAYTGGLGITQSGNDFSLVSDGTLTISTDTVVVNTATIATQAYVGTQITGMTKKFAFTLAGNVAYATGEVVTHNLNTRDIQVSVVSTSTPWAAVEVDWEATSVNTVTVRYNPVLASVCRAVVIG